MRIALFGGSFNPPHVGHVLAVGYVLSCVDVDAVWLAPTYQHAFGKSLIAFEHRMEMCRLAVQMYGERAVVSDVERQLGGESRTIRVVEHLLAEDPSRELRLVVGADILDEAHKWLEFERLIQLAPMVVMGRSGYERSDPRIFGLALPEVSSTELRALLAAGDREACLPLLPRSVLDYIEDQGCYR